MMFCTECGAKLAEGSEFCTQCGAKLDSGKADVGADKALEHSSQPAVSVASASRPVSEQTDQTKAMPVATSQQANYVAPLMSSEYEQQPASSQAASFSVAPTAPARNNTPIIIAAIVGVVVIVVACVLVFALTADEGADAPASQPQTQSQGSNPSSDASSSSNASANSSSAPSVNSSGYAHTEYVTGDDKVPGLSIQNVTVERAGSDYNVDATIYNSSSKYAYKDITVEIVLMDASGAALAQGTTKVQVTGSGNVIEPSTGSGVVKAAMAYSGSVAKANIKVVSATKMYD